MIRDRLYELRPFNTEESIEIEVDTSMQKHDEELYKVLNRFLVIREQIDLIRQNIDTMKSLINEQKFHYKDKNIRDQIENLISDSLSKSKNVHNSIKSYQEELKLPSQSYTIFRIKNMQLALIKNDYLNVYREHTLFVEKYEEKLKKVLKREAQIMSRNISIEETEALIAEKEQVPSLFVGNILEETEKAQCELREIVQRHNMLMTLEKTLEEVRDMFFQISTYVMEQGSLIQVIEYETENATTYVDKGGSELEKARELQIKALKKKTYILIILLIVLGIIILILIIT